MYQELGSTRHHALSYLILLCQVPCFVHFIDKETEVQKNEIIILKLLNTGLALSMGSSNSRASIFKDFLCSWLSDTFPGLSFLMASFSFLEGLSPLSSIVY